MKTIKLRFAATILNSNVDKVSRPEERQVRLCNYVDVYHNDNIKADMDFMSATATHDEIRRFRLLEGDIIITKDSEDKKDIGVPAIVENSAPDLLCGYHLALLRPNRRLYFPKFLFWAFLSKPVREAFSLAANGVTRYGMTIGGIKEVQIPYVDLKSQMIISDFLDFEANKLKRLLPILGSRGDGRDANDGSLIHLLRKHRLALITAAVTEQIDPTTYRRKGKTDRTLEQIEKEMTQ